jgi:hypothetical protein
VDLVGLDPYRPSRPNRISTGERFEHADPVAALEVEVLRIKSSGIAAVSALQSLGELIAHRPSRISKRGRICNWIWCTRLALFGADLVSTRLL